jgi:hypothetical protein
MTYYMVRSIDHAGYYETRLILAGVGIAIAGYAAFRRGDYRYAIMFASGVIFQALMELILQQLGFRGKGYQLSVFGYAVPLVWGPLIQGLTEGGIISLMSFWFADLLVGARADRGWWTAFLTVYVLIVGLAFVVGYLGRGEPISSPRPMTVPVIWAWAGGTIVFALVLVGLRGTAGFRELGLFFLGVVIYLTLTYTPMQILGARYIAVEGANGSFVPAGLAAQAGWMAWSHTYEVAGGKLHYFAIPYVFGLLRPPQRGG